MADLPPMFNMVQQENEAAKAAAASYVAEYLAENPDAQGMLTKTLTQSNYGVDGSALNNPVLQAQVLNSGNFNQDANGGYQIPRNSWIDAQNFIQAAQINGAPLALNDDTSTDLKKAYNAFATAQNTADLGVAQLDALYPRDGISLWGQGITDFADAVLAVGSGLVLGPAMAGAATGSGGATAAGAAAGAETGAFTGRNASDVLVGGISGGLGAQGLSPAGSIAAKSGVGALRNSLEGQDPLSGAIQGAISAATTGGISGGLDAASSTSGTNATSSGRAGGAVGGLAGPTDLTTDLSINSTSDPDLTYAGSQDITAPSSDASAAANFLNPVSQPDAVGLGGPAASNVTPSGGSPNSSVSSIIGAAAPIVSGAAVPNILSALGLGGGPTGNAIPSVGGSSVAPDTSLSSVATPSVTSLNLTPSLPGVALGGPTMLDNSAADDYETPSYSGGQKGYGSGSNLAKILSELGIGR